MAGKSVNNVLPKLIFSDSEDDDDRESFKEVLYNVIGAHQPSDTKAIASSDQWEQPLSPVYAPKLIEKRPASGGSLQNVTTEVDLSCQVLSLNDAAMDRASLPETEESQVSQVTKGCDAGTQEMPPTQSDSCQSAKALMDDIDTEQKLLSADIDSGINSSLAEVECNIDLYKEKLNNLRKCLSKVASFHKKQRMKLSEKKRISDSQGCSSQCLGDVGANEARTLLREQKRLLEAFKMHKLLIQGVNDLKGKKIRCKSETKPSWSDQTSSDHAYCQQQHDSEGFAAYNSARNDSVSTCIREESDPKSPHRSVDTGQNHTLHSTQGETHIDDIPEGQMNASDNRSTVCSPIQTGGVAEFSSRNRAEGNSDGREFYINSHGDKEAVNVEEQGIGTAEILVSSSREELQNLPMEGVEIGQGVGGSQISSDEVRTNMKCYKGIVTERGRAADFVVTNVDEGAMDSQVRNKQTHLDPRKRHRSLHSLIDDGIITPGTNLLTVMCKGSLVFGTLTPDGKIRTETGQTYVSAEDWVYVTKDMKFTRQSAWKLVKYKGKPLSSYLSTEGNKQSQSFVAEEEEIGLNQEGRVNTTDDDALNRSQRWDPEVALIQDKELFVTSQILPENFWDGLDFNKFVVDERFIEDINFNDC